MAKSVYYNRLGESYDDLLQYIELNGALVSSRIGLTRELTGFTLVLSEPEYSLVGRTGMSDTFALEEITQLLAGRYDQERLRAAVPRAADLITEATAYGPRVFEQLLAVERELTRDRCSRRAVVYVGRHDDLPLTTDDAERRAGEMPCTCVWQFLVRDSLLEMHVYMRSWDAVWGLSYDVPSFVAVQLALASSLNVELGEYVHHAGSIHVYERHFGVMTWPRAGTVFDLAGHLIGRTIRETSYRAREAMDRC